MTTSYLSQEGYDKLVQELEDLKTNGRKTIAERLKHAKELGDLSENSEYQEAKESKNRLEQHIQQLEEVLRQTVIIKKTEGSTTVRIGSHVKVKKNNETFAYTIVGFHEAKPEEGKISNESPIGRALLGKKAGDTVEVKVPKGVVLYTIAEID